MTLIVCRVVTRREFCRENRHLGYPGVPLRGEIGRVDVPSGPGCREASGEIPRPRKTFTVPEPNHYDLPVVVIDGE